MAHQLQLKKANYRQWVKAGLGLGYLKEGLAPFCNDIADQQHKDILQTICSTKSLPLTVTCGSCRVETLKPDHNPVGNAGKKFCPLGQVKCSCCVKGKISCPNNICGAIYDSIVKCHASTPPAPNWKHSDAQQWSVDPWSICKCFINAPGYEQKQSACDTDCTGLLHLLINNRYFHSHIGCNVTGTNNLFSKVRQYRNSIFHSSNMELEEKAANSYIDDMIAVLQDGKELLQRSDAQIAVKKLQDLKKKDFIITTESFEEILKQIKEENAKILKSTENVITKCDDLKKKLIELETKMSEEKLENELSELKKSISEFKAQMCKENKEKLEMEIKQVQLKNKLSVLETLISEQKEEIAKIKTETSSGQGQTDYKQAKLEWREKLIEQYHKTLLQVSTTPLQPTSDKSSFNEIYIRPKIAREIKEEKGEIRDVKVNTMSEIFTKNGVPQKYVYLLGYAGSGKTSFCKYLINCWCLAHSKEHEADKEKEDGIGKPEGDSEKHRGYDEEHGCVNENDGGSEKHGGGNEEHERHGVVDEFEGGNEEHGGDYEENEKDGSDIVNEEIKGGHSGDIENEEDSKKHHVVNEKRGEEKDVGDLKKNGSDSDDIQEDSDDFIHSKSDSGDILTDSESDSDTDLTNNEFHSDDSKYDSKSYELKFNGVKEMKKFDFVFYIPLRRYQNIDTIDEMLQKRYQMKMLNTLLENESSRVMILLDGLDEWSSGNVPEHSIFKEYTIVTTSRPWKFHTLRSSDVEIEQSLKLKGFDLRCEREMVNRTVSQLNVRRHARKEARDCMNKLNEESLKSLKQVPIMLQQLICLWFDGKLDKTSRCAIYTGMLELFFTWNDMRTARTRTAPLKGTQEVNLPQYLEERTKLRSNTHFIYEMSKLAFETLFHCPKDKSLTFDICIFDDLEISDVVKENCLKLGIITEDEWPSLSVSEPPSSLFSFIHKSMQEFLAAANIGITFNTKIGSSDGTDHVDVAKKFIYRIFRKCSTVNDILEQSNVFIMLCGLEPRLATHVSKYIYDTVSKDARVQEYRRTINSEDYLEYYPIDSDTSCIIDIQKIVFEIIEECNLSFTQGNRSVFYIGDLVISDEKNCDIVCTGIDKHQIDPDFVLSIKVDDINSKNEKITKYLPIFRHLEKIKIQYGIEFEDISKKLSSTQSDNSQSNKQRINEINKCVSETIKVNTLTFKCLSLGSAYYTNKRDVYNNRVTKEYYPVCETVVSCLPCMNYLVAIRMSNITMSHDSATTLCNFLEGTSHLEQIYLYDVQCECENQHNVNLSKHQQLQYLYLYNTVSVIDADTTNLEILTFKVLKISNYEKIFNIITKSYKLKELELYGDYESKYKLYHIQITKRLAAVLTLLQNLNKLELQYCRLSESIIQSPLKMTCLKNIELYKVIMSLTTWREFVDSLPCIPHTVNVSVKYCCITGDDEELNFDILKLTSLEGLGGEKKYDAKQYVKDKNQLFHVKHDDYSFEWSTKK